MNSDKELFVEVVERSFGPFPLISALRPASAEDLEAAEALHRVGACPHRIVFDEKAGLYDFRTCYTCGAALGTV